jgi:hypothetical protein
MEKEVATHSTIECNFPEERNEDQFADRGALPAGRSGGIRDPRRLGASSSSSFPPCFFWLRKKKEKKRFKLNFLFPFLIFVHSAPGERESPGMVDGGWWIVDGAELRNGIPEGSRITTVQITMMFSGRIGSRTQDRCHSLFGSISSPTQPNPIPRSFPSLDPNLTHVGFNRALPSLAGIASSRGKGKRKRAASCRGGVEWAWLGST